MKYLTFVLLVYVLHGRGNAHTEQWFKFGCPAPAYPTTTKNERLTRDGSNPDARIKCTDDEQDEKKMSKKEKKRQRALTHSTQLVVDPCPCPAA
jgi:hypothetical protein